MKGDQERLAPAKRAVLRGEDNDVEYSDYEEDVTNAQLQTEEQRNSPGWKPPFLVRHDSNAANPASPVGAVPITPSLIRAMDRIAVAQAQAYGSSSGPDTSTASPEVETESILARKQRWESFWRDVTVKASEGTNAR